MNEHTNRPGSQSCLLKGGQLFWSRFENVKKPPNGTRLSYENFIELGLAGQSEISISLNKLLKVKLVYVRVLALNYKLEWTQKR